MVARLRIALRWKILKRYFRRYLTQSISRRMIINYVTLGALPIVIVSVILISLSLNTVKSYTFQRNLEIARRASDEISLFLEEPLTILNTLAQTRDILEMERFTQSRLINKIKIGNAIFRKIFILDQDGRATVTTSFGEELKDYSSEDFFRVAMNGQTYYSQVYFTPSRFPVMLIALPIKKYNLVEGVLAGEIDLKTIWDLVDNITIGKTGTAFLLSSDGSVIAHPEKQLVLQEQSFAGYSFFQTLANQREGVTFFENNSRKMIAAFAAVPDLNWCIVIQQSEAEAFELATKMRDRVIVVVALTIIIALALATASVKRITSPIDNLVKGVRQYAAGNLNHRIEIQRQDELAELAHEFNAMAESLDINQKKLRRMERLAALSRFASMVSHEIRNPLNAMNINMQILRRLISNADAPEEKKLKYLDIISSEINRMNSLVTNYLMISRPPELNLIRVDLHKILEEVILLQEGRATKGGIRIFREFTEEPIYGMFDENQLKQVFHNITLNAFDAMPQGGEFRLITSVESRKQPDRIKRYVVIKFVDTGQGIPAGKLNDIFEFYYTTKKAGTGLGLAIAKQIIEGHRGKIYIKSQEQKGTTVFVELPLD
ncbi:MAG: ATP-binding protein [Calditrichia bacterium]